ncbi:MAG: LON peptidase substrate-binding domain-containing protein, partial [Armatimonadetes bacterium]|nr:LON peptidase substrate-binding domain-containing protein [Armatimonadota bacterium]
MELEAPLSETALPGELAILPVDEMVVFPYMVVPIAVGEGDSELINAVVAGDRFLGCVMRQPAPEQASDSEPPFYEVGCAVQLHKMIQMPDDSRRILLRGVTRIRIEEFTQVEPYRIAKITELVETPADESDEEIQALRQSLLNTFEEIIELSPGMPEEAVIQAL